MPWLPQDVWRKRLIGPLPTGEAADAALRIFCTPALSEHRHGRHGALIERARFHLRHAHWQRIETPIASLQCYLFEPEGAAAGTVLMIHGWTGEASFMTALAEPVRRSGFRVVLLDLPAHGLSAGRSTNLIDCARATADLAAGLGPIDAIVTHSFGSMVALVAAEGAPPMPHAVPVGRFVLVASPDRLGDLTADFARHWRLSEDARRGFERRLERIGHRPVATFAVSRLLVAIGRPALIVHATDDAEVPFRHAEEIMAAVKSAELERFDGLGHRNILFTPHVARRIVAYLRR